MNKFARWIKVLINKKLSPAEEEYVPQKTINRKYVFDEVADMKPSLTPYWDLVYLLKESRPDKNKRTIIPTIVKLVEEGLLVKIKGEDGLYRLEVRQDAKPASNSSTAGADGTDLQGSIVRMEFGPDDLGGASPFQAKSVSTSEPLPNSGTNITLGGKFTTGPTGSSDGNSRDADSRTSHGH